MQCWIKALMNRREDKRSGKCISLANHILMIVKQEQGRMHATRASSRGWVGRGSIAENAHISKK